MPPNSGEALPIIKSHVNFDRLQDARHGDEDVADWELLPELPTPEEIMNPNASTDDLPWFPVTHRWESKGEYLAALYKILRFEGTEGLRYSVNSFKLAPNMHDDTETCIYTKVRVRGYLFSRMGPIARVCFSTYRAGAKINWQQSTRLMPGKIVALSDDNFRTDCRIAVIAQRPFEGGLDQNPPLVDIIWANPDQAVINPDQDLIMVESRNGYYESVRHALRGLQHAMREWSPIDKYTVSLDRRDLVCSLAPTNFDLRALILDPTPTLLEQCRGDKDLQQRTFQELKERFNNVRLGEFHNIKPHTSLDDSQMEALERIVSKELAIVQGPPGTGKTHTSIKSLKTILDNRRPGDPPVVVAAQTNHALDQLLLHGLTYNVNIMRVGGRTDNEAIKERRVYELRRQTEKVPIQGPYGGAIEKERKQLVAKFQALVDQVFGGDGLLNAPTLLEKGVISEAQFKSLEDDEWLSGEDKSSIEVWLGEEKIERHRQFVVDESDFLEMEAVGDFFELDANLDDDQPLADDEDDRIFGEFIALSSQHTGATPLQPHWEVHCRSMLDNNDLFQIPRGYRGGAYQIMQSKLLDSTASQFRGILKRSTQLAQDRKIGRWLRDLHVVDKHCIDVVGCTTTGLTKYRGFLSALQPRILLIEEAAETREANIAAALFPCLQQLILVGDHQQLPPSCDITRLSEDPYNLNISMFERLVKNGLPYTMLNEQRRMAPELRYIVQKFYPELQDHPLVKDVNNRPLIPGMGERRSWFFNHQWPEEVDANNSKFNMKEVEMIVAFIIYLIRNGVNVSELTVLTYYKGQKRKILQRLRGEDVPIGSFFKVVTVDSYQGEENEIVLLSLVRSPQAGGVANAGFLDSRNRATVAVSRARRGFFVFGNKDNLLSACNRSFLTWRLVWNGFAEQKRVLTSKGLPLVCQNHSREIWAKDPDDLVGNAGGCDAKCGKIRSCGHSCVLPCHYWPHEKLPCQVPCAKNLACGHKCGSECSNPCFCSQNCPESAHLEMQKQISKLALNGDGVSDASSETIDTQTRQSSPDKWQRFSVNPQIHDDAVRNEVLRGRQEARKKTPRALEIKETFMPVSTSTGSRLDPSHQVRPSRAQQSAPRQEQAVFGRNAIGYHELHGFIQPRWRGDRNPREVVEQPSTANMPVVRNTRNSQRQAQMTEKLVYPGKSEPEIDAFVEFNQPGFDDDRMTAVTDAGFEAEVLGHRSMRRTTLIKRQNQTPAQDNSESLIDFST